MYETHKNSHITNRPLCGTCVIYYFNSFHICRKKISLNQIGVLNLPNQLLIKLPSAVSPSFKSIENINSKNC